jgi:hypothetical protein
MVLLKNITTFVSISDDKTRIVIFFENAYILMYGIYSSFL